MEWGRRKGGEQGRCRREGEGEGGGGEEGKREGRKKLYIQTPDQPTLAAVTGN